MILKATKGLKPEAVGRVTLKLGEGLTGLALKELRPICERQASRNPHYRYFPEIGEEPYESFLAVPILRGQTRIGAMVLQNSAKNYFNEQDIQAFRAITSQLANTIETAKMLMTLDEQQLQGRAGFTVDLKLIKGRVAAGGTALGGSLVLDERQRHLSFESLRGRKGKGKYGLEDFRRAVEAAERQLEDLQNEIEKKLSDVASLIFTAQILILKDQAFVGEMERRIREGVPPPEAVIDAVEEYSRRFEQLPTPYLREKSHDVRDVGRRLLENLIGGGGPGGSLEGRVVIAEELLPSDILKMSSQRIAGVVLLSGGVTSHLSILTRSLRIPMVITEESRLLQVRDGTRIFLDADEGNIYIDPAEETIVSLQKREKERREVRQKAEAVLEETHTKDGTRVHLLANINLLGDLDTALEAKAEGVGLYRTEFPFIVRSDFPSEEEQLVIYQKLVDKMRGKEVVFRTLDIGGDKVLSYYHHAREENPFLGMRSIRFSLQHRDIFVQQIRAVLRAAKGTEVRIMFPMISSVDEFREAKGVVRDCLQELRKDKLPHTRKVKIGVMLELPAILEIIDELAHAADFFSIGTNDFVQYMLAVDRTNEKVADFYLPHHPSVLRAFNRIVRAADRHRKDVSICGDMAHDERYVPYFLGIGVRKFSIDPAYFPRIQQAIGRTDLERARRETATLLKRSTVRDTAAFVKRQEEKRRPR